MEGIEILMKVENSFGIKIPNEEAGKIITAGQLHNAVWKQLSGKNSESCKSQSLFYILRKALNDTLHFPARNIKLETSPNDLFPLKNRRQVYYALAQSTKLKFPNLVLDKHWEKILKYFGLISILGSLTFSIILIIFFNYSTWMLLITVLGVSLTIFLSNLFEPKRIIIDAPSFRTFTEKTLALNYSSFAKETGTNRKEMELVINLIIADMAGLDVEAIAPEKKLGDDLGID